ncbi:uncharacterized protein RHO17_007551 isoform 3-T20 [Thomomys bottae]
MEVVKVWLCPCVPSSIAPSDKLNLNYCSSRNSGKTTGQDSKTILPMENNWISISSRISTCEEKQTNKKPQNKKQHKTKPPDDVFLNVVYFT